MLPFPTSSLPPASFPLSPFLFLHASILLFLIEKLMCVNNKIKPKHYRKVSFHPKSQGNRLAFSELSNVISFLCFQKSTYIMYMHRYVCMYIYPHACMHIHTCMFAIPYTLLLTQQEYPCTLLFFLSLSQRMSCIISHRPTPLCV